MVITDVKRALEIAKGFLEELERLKQTKYSIGKDDLTLLDRKIKTFLNRVFPDAKERQKDYYNAVHAWYIAVISEKSEGKKQEDYLDQIRKMILFVKGLIDELEIYGLNFRKVGPSKTETEREVSGGIPGLLRGKYRKRVHE